MSHLSNFVPEDEVYRTAVSDAGPFESRLSMPQRQSFQAGLGTPLKSKTPSCRLEKALGSQGCTSRTAAEGGMAHLW